MNIIKFLIEVTRDPKEKPEKTIYELISDCIVQDQSFEGNYKEAIQKEWIELQFDLIKTINSPKYLIGGFEKSGIRIFVFEKRIDGVNNRNNLTLEVIAFADLPANNILNDSYSKLKSVFKKIKTDYIQDSQILIYPYDTARKDIWSPDLKINANMISPFLIDKKQIGKWIFIGFLTSIFIILFLSTDDIKPSYDEARKQVIQGSDLKAIYSSLMLSGIFYIILELVIHLIIPYLFFRNKKDIQITNLSSIVDKSDPFSEAKGKPNVLTTPNIEE
ncbi:hypothetical protein [Tenacibaculum mesophilum]|uniref:hypothetical protein n=1 Tax=Tenacibaculum mesophilum TaxID=104268 RepID=UPI003F5F3A09